MKGLVKLDPVESAVVVALSGNDMGQQVSMLEEPTAAEDIEDVEDGWIGVDSWGLSSRGGRHREQGSTKRKGDGGGRGTRRVHIGGSKVR